MTIALPALRKQLRSQRRQLDRYQQRQTEQRCLQRLIHMPEFKQARHVGLYLHAFGEVATDRMIWQCFKQHKKVYLPLICNMTQHLRWVNITAQQYRQRRFCRHRLGMQQPMATHTWPVTHLDLLVMPLLACDPTGLRLGMGGGYYDRTLAMAAQRPFRLGLAHEFQYLEQTLPAQAWDQALHALLSPQHLRYF